MRFFRSAGFGILTLSVAMAAQNAGAQQSAVGIWAKKAPMRFARSEFQAAAVNGKIYVIGGGRADIRDGKPFDSYTNGDTDEYDPTTDSWRARTPMPEGGTHNSIAVLDGKIYIAGGFAGRQHTLPTASLHSYDPATDTWRKLASLSTPRASISLTALNGKIHAFGGRLMGEETSLATHELYDPKTDTWTLAAPMPSSRDHAGIWVVDGKAYLFGGRTGDSNSSVALNEIYDPTTDKWSAAAPMPTGRSSGAYAQYRGLLFFMGGECKTTPAGRTTFDENEAYDPKGNAWRKLAPLPIGRHGFAAAAIGNTLYVLGGSTACGSGGKVADNLAFVLP
ncbi:MAG TPA: kelch repeat-containing protein [Xanthobacteraceae bacterium]|jgi:N-acetylneuraminic acid mutarotase